MPIQSKSRSTPSRARSTDTHDGASLLNNSIITSSPGLKSESSFAGIVGGEEGELTIKGQISQVQVSGEEVDSAIEALLADEEVAEVELVG